MLPGIGIRTGGRTISVIMAAYKEAALLERGLASLLAQTDPHWEVVISPDDGADYTRLEQRDPRIRVVRTRASDTGPGAARNRALAVASGDYIAVLDDDDTL